jgi:gentisate 1,2-dioxygenase
MSVAVDRKEFYARLKEKSASPLWEVLGDIVRKDPRTAVQAALWRYDEMRPFIAEAGRLITAEEAERRVLILENPGLPGMSRITQSLYAGLQLILPGEIAHTHRHTASALRFILEGTGAYTSVDGERLTMKPGDFILTPFWSYHDHGNPGGEPVVWLDGLDIPTVNMFDTSFFEKEAEHDHDHDEEGAPAAKFVETSVMKYPYEPHRDTLAAMAKRGGPDPRQGYKLEYRNSKTGAAVLPTIGAYLQLLPKGFSSNPSRATDATIYCAVEGRGTSTIGDKTFTWGPRDIFVAPSWHAVSHHADDEAVLFSFSDRPAQNALGIWREEA